MIRLGWINSLVSGLLVSSCCPCCLLQIFLNLFGIGCAGLNTFLLPYRSIFISLTIISLTYSYFRYRPSKWHFTAMLIFTLFLSFSPEILRTYNNHYKPNNTFDDNVIITHWQIIGMNCESCRSVATRSLEKLKGVINVNVDLDTGQADLISRVIIDDDIIIQAVQSAGFQTYKII